MYSILKKVCSLHFILCMSAFLTAVVYLVGRQAWSLISIIKLKLLFVKVVISIIADTVPIR